MDKGATELADTAQESLSDKRLSVSVFVMSGLKIRKAFRTLYDYCAECDLVWNKQGLKYNRQAMPLCPMCRAEM